MPEKETEILKNDTDITKENSKDPEISRDRSPQRKRRRNSSRDRSNSPSRRKRSRSRSPYRRRRSVSKDRYRRNRRSRSNERRRNSSRSRSRSSERKKSPVRRRRSPSPIRKRRSPSPQKRNDNESPRRKQPREDKAGDIPENEQKNDNQVEERKPVAPGKTGGLYMPPGKLAMLQKEIKDKSSVEYQKMTWEALKKSINGLINKVSIGNIQNLIPEIFYENLIRGRGLFVRSMMKAQAASPNFTPVYAALIAVINTKLPELGELLVRRLIIQFRKAFRRNHKPTCLATAQFIAHLVNQQVLGLVVPLQIATLLLDKPTEDSVEVACAFLTECGATLQDQSPVAFNRVFDRFRSILHEGIIDKRVQYTIETLFAVRKTGFAEHPALRPELDLVSSEDQISHDDISLDDNLDPDDRLNFFHFDENFEENEKRYDLIRREALGDETIEELEGRDLDEEEESEEEEEEQPKEGNAIQDNTETDLINLRRTIYLTIMSSVDFNECAHKLLKIKLKPSQEIELCNMIIECASQERTYMRFYGLLAQRFCMLDKIYQEGFDQAFVEQYSTIHRLETNKLRNVAKFFSHLLQSDALPWNVLEYIHLNEDETTSSSRIFIKIIFQELAEWLGLQKLNERLNDEFMKQHFEGLFPIDNPRNTRFAINFFTSIGLGGLTDGLREHLKNAPKQIKEEESSSESESESSSSSSSSESDSSPSDSDSSSDSD